MLLFSILLFLNLLLRLSPDNVDKEQPSGRSCTVQLRCIIADAPMRLLLKRTKYHTGHWSCDRCIQKGVTINGCYRLNDIIAPRRIASEFLRYFVSDESLDEHIPNPLDRSPFLRLGDVGMVTSFGIDTMHTGFSGAFSRRICGFAGKSKRNEGQLSQVQLAKVNERLQRFKKCKMYKFDSHVGPLNTSKNYKRHPSIFVLSFLSYFP